MFGQFGEFADLVGLEAIECKRCGFKFVGCLCDVTVPIELPACLPTEGWVPWKKLLDFQYRWQTKAGHWRKEKPKDNVLGAPKKPWTQAHFEGDPDFFIRL